MTGHRFDPTILRDYDIRGVAGKTLHEADAYALGRSFATVLRAEGGLRVAVGRDGRLSSPGLEEALVRGLGDGGIGAVRIGLGPTPMLYYAEASMQDVQGGIQVTGSHNPPDQNGFKLVRAGAPFCGEDIQHLGAIAASGQWSAGRGVERRVDPGEIIGAYAGRLAHALDPIDRGEAARLRIGWDAGNGAAGPVIEALVQLLPGEHHLLYTSVDGRFPNHHPDPTIPANLADLAALVAAKSLDFGVAFDGDGDRIGVVDSTGAVLAGDQLLMIFAEDLLKSRPGAAVVADVKTSDTLFARVSALGGRPHMGKSGHTRIKSEMKLIGALLGGEMSGHICFADDYYGFDDALYAALRLIVARIRLGKGVAALRAALPVSVSTPELRFAVPEARKFAIVDDVRERLLARGAQLATIDGVRVSTPDGWWLLRASNTEAALTVRAESTSAAGLERLLSALDGELARSGIARPPG